VLTSKLACSLHRARRSTRLLAAVAGGTASWIQGHYGKDALNTAPAAHPLYRAVPHQRQRTLKQTPCCGETISDHALALWNRLSLLLLLTALLTPLIFPSFVSLDVCDCALMRCVQYANNLGPIFAPIFLRPRALGPHMVHDAKLAAEVTKNLIEHMPSLFDVRSRSLSLSLSLSLSRDSMHDFILSNCSPSCRASRRNCPPSTTPRAGKQARPHQRHR
jgi:hypothetical protein